MTMIKIAMCEVLLILNICGKFMIIINLVSIINSVTSSLISLFHNWLKIWYRSLAYKFTAIKIAMCK